MSTHASQCRFPLYLTPIETFMRLDDRPAYPMTFVVQMDFTGNVDRPAFESALEEGLRRHPLLGAVVQRAKRNQPCWVAADDPLPPVEWADEGVPVECPGGEGIDIGSRTGLRVWVRQGDGSSRIVMQFHHACCDGIGSYRFIGDVLALYGARTATNGQRPEPGPVDVGLLRGRKNGIMDLALNGRPTKAAWAALRQGAEILGRRAAPLHPPTPTAGRNGYVAPFPAVQTYRFDEENHKRLRLTALGHGVTVNDLLLGELFHSMREWNARHPARRNGRRLCIMMPTDLRGTEHFELPAANMTGYTFIARQAGECDRPDELLRGIRNETALIKHERRGTRFVDTIAVALYVRGLLPLALSARRCLSTAVLSNVGDPSRRFTARFPREKGRVVCGNLVLESFSGVPPLRPKTRATISIFTYRRQLGISLRCDPYLFRPEDTAEQLSIFVDRLKASGR
jgi:hypothetical protein